MSETTGKYYYAGDFAVLLLPLVDCQKEGWRVICQNGLLISKNVKNYGALVAPDGVASAMLSDAVFEDDDVAEEYIKKTQRIKSTSSSGPTFVYCFELPYDSAYTTSPVDILDSNRDAMQPAVNKVVVAITTGTVGTNVPAPLLPRSYTIAHGTTLKGDYHVAIIDGVEQLTYTKGATFAK